jgi:hypothetical protein
MEREDVLGWFFGVFGKDLKTTLIAPKKNRYPL